MEPSSQKNSNIMLLLPQPLCDDCRMATALRSIRPGDIRRSQVRVYQRTNCKKLIWED